MHFKAQISEFISNEVGEAFECDSIQSLGGGCINEAYKVESSGLSYFVKTNALEQLEMFQAEADGLRQLESADSSLRIPKVIGVGQLEDCACLVLEFILMRNVGDAQSMGRGLAQLHRKTQSTFGWYRDNTIGNTPQLNLPESSDWITFYRDNRLLYQFHLAAKNGRSFDGADSLLEGLASFFEGYEPVPSLLHGDLWGGNASFDDKQQPVIFDPAVYYGDREAELAFTEMFGGFGDAFYRAYEAEWPLHKGYAQRKVLYNLYHVLNHFNLFGGSYASQADAMIRQLLAHLA